VRQIHNYFQTIIQSLKSKNSFGKAHGSNTEAEKFQCQLLHEALSNASASAIDGRAIVTKTLQLAKS